MPVIFGHLAGAFAPAQLVVPGAVAIAYAVRGRNLARAGRPVPAARQWCFHGGLVLIVATLLSPIGHISDELLSVHMAEHLLIGDIAALLLVLGLTGPLLAPLLRVRTIDRLRVLSHPALALPLWAADLFIWHLPGAYQAALHHSGIHALEHTMFIGFGMNMWMPLFGPLPKPARFTNVWKLAYILAVRLTGGLMANVFVWSGSVFYPSYAKGERFWGVSPTSDQIAAGAIMMVEGSILTLILFGWLFLRAAREGEESQELSELALARGIALSEGRADRAVAAGRGAELRRRIEAGESLKRPG
jgi:cytochrome c oxidase assembly factor CtaG